MADIEYREENAVQVTGLGKVYYQGAHRIDALRSVDLSIQRGEFVAIMGASGSGKSTLLHLIAGLTRPSFGSVTIEGTELARLSDNALTRFRRRKIGLVFQNGNLIPNLTAMENIMIPVWADRTQIGERKERIRSLLDRLGMSEQIAQLPETLSGGQRQRIALVRALAMDPTILLADEPTGNLDSVNSRKICELFGEIFKARERTCIVVTHEPAVAIWSDRLLFLKDGAILADCPTRSFTDAHDLAAQYQEIVEHIDSLPSEESERSEP